LTSQFGFVPERNPIRRLLRPNRERRESETDSIRCIGTSAGDGWRDSSRPERWAGLRVQGFG